MITRRATHLTGVLLALGACLPIAGVLLVAPVLPQIQSAFAGTPGIEFLAPILLAIPGLMIALFSSTAGYIADRVGRKRIMLAALVLYAVFGMAPLILTSLPSIIISRVATGLMEAIILTSTTTMIGDYFAGPLRERYLSLQVMFGAIAAVIFVVVGGIAGAHGWRGPFWFYAMSLVLFVPYLMLLWEPESEPAISRAGALSLPWTKLGGICALTLVAAIGFYIVPVQVGFLAAQVGIHASQFIGLIGGCANLGVGVGSFLFARYARVGTRSIVTVALILIGAGFLMIAGAKSLPLLLAGVVVNEIGCGAILPSLLTWAMAGLAFEFRGRGTGIWQTAFWFGEFVSPLLIVALSKAAGGLPGAVFTFGVSFLILAAGWYAFTARRAVGDARATQASGFKAEAEAKT